MSFTRPIPDLAEWNLRLELGGSPEVLPDHPEPRVEWESVEIPACGYTLPEHDDVTPEEAATKYRTKRDSYTFHQTDTQPTVIGFVEWEGSQSQTETTEVLREYYYDGAVSACSERIKTTSFDSSSGGEWTSPDGLSTTGNTFLYSSSSGPGPCSGGGTGRAYALGPYWGSGAFDTTTPLVYDYCPTVTLTPDNTWSYAGLVFSLNTTSTPSEFVTVTENSTVEYVAVTAADLIADLGALTLPDDANGTTPGSALLSDPDFPEVLTGARKASFRVGVPDGYAKPYFRAEWDIVFYPTAWLAWDAEDPGTRGPEPSPGPSLVSHSVWERIGSGTWDGPHEIPLPSEPGENNLSNLKTIGYRCRYGTKYTYWGPRWFPP